MNGMDIIVLPETLREKLGNQGAKDLVDLLNVSVRSLKENLSESAAERLERRLAETKSDLEKQLANTRADLIKWMFVFWVTQIAALYGLLRWL